MSLLEGCESPGAGQSTHKLTDFGEEEEKRKRVRAVVRERERVLITL